MGEIIRFPLRDRHEEEKFKRAFYRVADVMIKEGRGLSGESFEVIHGMSKQVAIPLLILWLIHLSLHLFY